MITVYEVVSEHYKTCNLPEPSQKDLIHIGKMISTHFRRYWGIMQRSEVLAEAGFTWSKEPGRTQLVIGYPNTFKSEMLQRIELFLQQKEERRQKTLKAIEKPTDPSPPETSSEPRKRNRKPVPHFTGKPLLKK